MSQMQRLGPDSGSSTGDVIGPASSTDNAIVRWSGTTGKIIKDSSTLFVEGTGTSTNASTEDIITYPLDTSAKAYHIEAFVVGYESTGPAAASYKLCGLYYTDGAAATLVGTVDVDKEESASLIASVEDMVVSGNSVILQLTGPVGLNVNYKATMNIIGVS